MKKEPNLFRAFAFALVVYFFALAGLSMLSMVRDFNDSMIAAAGVREHNEVHPDQKVEGTTTTVSSLRNGEEGKALIPAILTFLALL